MKSNLSLLQTCSGSFWRSCLFLLLFLVSTTSVVGRTNFPMINSAYKYDPHAPVHCHYYLAAQEDSIHIYLKIEVAGGVLEQDYTLGYELKEDYGEKSLETVDSLDIEDFLLAKENDTYYLKIPLKLETPVRLMLLAIKDRQSSTFYYDIPLNLETNFSIPNLLLLQGKKNIPVFNAYVKGSEPIRIVNSFDSRDTSRVYLYKYTHEFNPSLPPMATGTDQIEKALEIDSLFGITMGAPFQLDPSALFLAQIDTSTLKGIAFRTVPYYYPEYGKPEELIKPLIYISTKSEMTKVAKADDLKRALDRYWLELIKTPSRAKSIIKSYYDQIEAANAVFTNYKEGWKTDQGMIYALYGIPDEVYFDGKEEQWIYQKDDGILRVKFIFVKIKNIFTDHHFELIRSKNYEDYWFGNVELWRKGIKGL